MTITIALASAAVLALGWLVVVAVARRLGCLGPSLTGYILTQTLAFGLFAFFGLQADAITYHRLAAEHAAASAAGQPRSAGIAFGKSGIVELSSLMYEWFGSSPVPILALISIVGGLLPATIFAATRNFGLTPAALTSAWLSAILPQILFWVPHLRREALSFMFLALMVLAASLIYRRNFARGFSLMLVAIAFMTVTRSQLVVVGVVGGVLAVLLGQRPRKWGRDSARHWLLGITIAAIAAPMIISFSSTLQLERLFSADIDRSLTSNASSRQGLRVDGASYAFNYSAGGFAVNTVRFIAGPLPWEWQNLNWLVVSADAVVFFAALVLTARAAARPCIARRPAIILLGMVAPLVAGGALTLANYGIVWRVRDHALVILIPVVAYAIVTRRSGRHPCLGHRHSLRERPKHMYEASPYERLYQSGRSAQYRYVRVRRETSWTPVT